MFLFTYKLNQCSTCRVLTAVVFETSSNPGDVIFFPLNTLCSKKNKKNKKNKTNFFYILSGILLVQCFVSDGYFVYYSERLIIFLLNREKKKKKKKKRAVFPTREGSLILRHDYTIVYTLCIYFKYFFATFIFPSITSHQFFFILYSLFFIYIFFFFRIAF